MKAAAQIAPELTRLRESIESVPMAVLTHFDGNDVLVGRSMAPLEMDEDGAMWFFTDRRSLKAQYLRRAYLTVMQPAGGTCVALSGHGEIHVDRARRKRLWAPFSRSRLSGRQKTSRLALLKFVPEMAECLDALQGGMNPMLALVN